MQARERVYWTMLVLMGASGHMQPARSFMTQIVSARRDQMTSARHLRAHTRTETSVVTELFNKYVPREIELTSTQVCEYTLVLTVCSD